VFTKKHGTASWRIACAWQKQYCAVHGKRGAEITRTLSRVKNRNLETPNKTKLVMTAPKYPNSLRTVPLNREAEFALSCMLSLYGRNRFDEDLILTTQNGMPPTIQNLGNTLKKICNKC